MSMMDLFRQEADNHSTVLSENLRILENDFGNQEILALLMRSAHSLKGAARIMDIDAVVSLANGMEGAFIAAQEEKIILDSEGIFMLLQGADKFEELAQVPNDEVEKWLTERKADLDELVQGYEELAKGSKTSKITPRGTSAKGKTAEEEIIEDAAPLETVPEEESIERKTRDFSQHSQPREKREFPTDLSSMSMMDLFRQEAETHCETLSDNLLVIEKNAENPEALASLMRAAHSIKGAARVIDLHIAVGLAHAMEDVFVSAQMNKIVLGAEEIDQLLNGVDKLVELGNVPDGEVESWLVEQQTEIEMLANEYTTLSKSGKKTSRPVQKEKPTKGKTERSAAPAPQPKAVKKYPADLSSMSMIDLFRQEAEMHCQMLSDNLLALEKNTEDRETLASLMRAAHSIKGAARVIDLNVIVGLAHAMEEVFVAAQEGKITLSEDHFDSLLGGLDLFSEIAGQDERQLQAWFKEQEVRIKSLEENYRTIAAGQKVAAVSRKQEKPRKPAVIKAKTSKGASEKAADRSLRISAEGMNRLMGFAGEVQVESRWLPSFAQKALLLKHRQDDVHRLLNSYSNSIGYGTSEELGRSSFKNMIARMDVCRNQLNDILNEIEDHARRSTEISHHLYEEVLANRMRPFADGIKAFPRMVRDVARELGKNVELKIIGEETLVDRDILDKIEAPLNHLIRNAIDHGMENPEQRLKSGKPEKGVIRLEARHSAGMLNIVVADDGPGIDIEKLRDTVITKKMIVEETARQLRDAELFEFIFLPNFTTRDAVSQVSGRGVGMDVVHSAVQEVRGVIRTHTELGVGTSFELQLPLTLSVMRSLLVEISDEVYAFPLAAIDHVVKLQGEGVREIEGRQYITFNKERIGLVSANQVLEKQEKKELKEDGDELLVLVISDHYNRYGLIVDQFMEIRDLVVQPLDRRLKKVQDISSVAILEDGTPVLIVDVEDMVRTIDGLITGNRLRRISSEDLLVDRTVKRILVVDDSITVREVERKMLAVKGYDVQTAVDGLDGWNTIRSEEFDLLVSDIDMPRMNGIELVTLIRQDERFKTLPIIIVSYKDREEDRTRGLEAGADYYLTKGSFQDEALVRAVEELIGEPSKS